MTPSTEPSVNLKNEVHYMSCTKTKKIIPSDIIRVLESDFPERAGDESLSQEDLKFLSKLRDNITKKNNGHYKMLFPFKEETLKLPNNQTCTIHHLSCLERRLKKDQR